MIRPSLRLCSRFPPAMLPLEYFVNKSKSLALYRSFIRSTKGLGDRSSRWETVKWIRTEFERYVDLVDTEKTKTLLSIGGRQLKQLNSAGMLVGVDGEKWRGLRPVDETILKR